VIFRRKPDKYVIRRKYIRMLYDLKHLHSRIKVYIARLESRISDIESKIVELKYRGDELRVKGYMKTLDIYKEVLKRLKIVDYALEYLLTKTETLLLIESMSRQINLFKYILTNIKDYVKGFPDIELIVEDLIERSNELVDYIKLDNKDLDIKASNEAMKILESAKVLAESKSDEVMS